jgi:hypothetical protein
MAGPFPSSSGTKASLQKAWDAAIGAAAMIKQRANQLRNQSVAGNVGASIILDTLILFADQKVTLQASATLPGIVSYAQTQVQDGAFDIAGSFTAMISAVDTARDWCIANFPKDANGYLLERTLDANGRWVDRQFTTADLATFRVTLNAIVAAID